MIKRLTLVLTILLLPCISSFAGQGSFSLYKGTVDNMPITLYLKKMPNECGGNDIYMAMYKYDKKSNWLQLAVATNEQSNWCLTEIGFTGVLILKSGPNVMNGVWISPDSKKQLKVSLKQQPLPEPEKKKMEDKLEQVNYENYDC